MKMVCSAVCIFSLRFRYEYVSVFGAVKKQTMRCSFTNKCVLQMGIDNRLFYESRVAIFVFEKTIGDKPLKKRPRPYCVHNESYAKRVDQTVC